MRKTRLCIGVALLLSALLGVGLLVTAEKVLTVGVIRDPINQRYATPGVEPYITGVYEQLVFVTPQMSLAPGLATAWERIDDLTWRFYLRRGVTYHNGKPFNASTAKFSLEWVTTMILWSGRLRFDRAEVVDEYTLDVMTKVPLAVFPGFMSHGWTVMSEPESQAAGEVVGTGPFKFESSIPGEELVVVKNEDYWQDGVPIVDRIVFKVIPDETSRTMALMSGEVNMALQIPYPSVSTIQTAGFKTFKTLTSQWAGLSFCVYAKPLDDLRVRKAIGHAINRESIINNVLYGMAVASNSPILPNSPWSGEASLEGLPYDPEKAKALLDEAGWSETPSGVREKDGEGLSIVLRVIDQPAVLIGGREMAQVMADQLGQVGFKVQISIEETNLFYDESAANHKGHLYLDYHGTFSGEQSATLWDSYQPNREAYVEGSAVYGDFLPSILEDWIFSLQNATTDQEKEEYLVKMSNLVNRDMVLTLPFINYDMVVGAAPEVTGYIPHPLFFWPAVWNTVDIK